jgi:hypothetical protein
MNKLVLKFYLCLVTVLCFTARLEAGTSIKTDTEQRIKNIQQQIEQHIENNTITSMQGAYLSDAVWSEVELLALIDKVKIIDDPNSNKNREKLAKKILNADLYTKLESTLMDVVKSSPSRGNIILAVRMLGKGLSSQKAKDVIQKRFNSELKNQLEKNYNNDPNNSLLYYLADALCYIGDESGISIVKQAIEAKESSSGRRCAAIRALTALSTNKAKTILRQNMDNVLLTEETTVAICAIKNLQLIDEFKSQLRQRLYKQLSRFAADSNIPSNQEEQQLLMNISGLLHDDILVGKLPDNEKNTVKKSVISILHNKSTTFGDRVAVLFAMLANDDDQDTIAMMLKSESSRYRSQGVRSIVTGSNKLQEHFIPDMIKMLDDTDSTTRDYALTVVRRYKGEKSGTGLSKEDFEKERDRIKQWWKEQQKEKNS